MKQYYKSENIYFMKDGGNWSMVRYYGDTLPPSLAGVTDYYMEELKKSGGRIFTEATASEWNAAVDRCIEETVKYMNGFKSKQLPKDWQGQEAIELTFNQDL